MTLNSMSYVRKLPIQPAVSRGFKSRLLELQSSHRDSENLQCHQLKLVCTDVADHAIPCCQLTSLLLSGRKPVPAIA